MSARVEVGAAGRPRKVEHAEKRKEKLGPGPWELPSPRGLASHQEQSCLPSLELCP